MTRLLVVTGTRADFGLWQPVLEAAMARDDLEPSLLVTAMHLEADFGSTAEIVRRARVPIAAEVFCTPSDDSRAAMAGALGVAVTGIAPVLVADPPDWLCVLGDRGEQLAAALAAVHLGIPIAHVHGGEQTLGAVDDTLRDMISRAAHVHMVANEEAAARLQRMGEEEWRISVTGGPGLDQIRQRDTSDDTAVRRRFGLPANSPFLVLLQHPETAGDPDPLGAIEATLAAVDAVGLPTFAIAPNADAGGRGMAATIARHPSLVGHVASLPRDEYLALLSGATALVGNSSSGIIEAPLLGVPAVNVGTRQAGRVRGDNVIDVPNEASAIERGIRSAIDPEFRDQLQQRSPYGDGFAAQRIVEVLATTRRDARLMTKRVAA